MVSRWFTHRRKVLLPAPDGPSRQTTSPRSTSRSIPRSTSVWPNDLRTPTASTRAIRTLQVVLPDRREGHHHEVPGRGGEQGFHDLQVARGDVVGGVDELQEGDH